MQDCSTQDSTVIGQKFMDENPTDESSWTKVGQTKFRQMSDKMSKESPMDVQRTLDEKSDDDGATNIATDATTLQSTRELHDDGRCDAMATMRYEVCVSSTAMVGGNTKNVVVQFRALWCYKLQRHYNSKRCGAVNRDNVVAQSVVAL
jgi:hypothetical protein